MVSIPSWPQVVAHRGAAALLPEHTLDGYLRAIADGAEALECDVRLTADGHLVCVHDSRIDRTSDGTGRVSNKTLAQLRNHDFASWWSRGRDVPDLDPHRPALAGTGSTTDGEPGGRTEVVAPAPAGARPGELGMSAGGEGRGVLTLDRLLEVVVDSPRRIDMAIETKHPTRYGGYVEQSLVHALQRFGLYQPFETENRRVRVMSFSSIAMRRMRDLAPSIPTVFLMEEPPRRLRSGQLPHDARIAGPSVAMVRDLPQIVRLWHARGRPVHVWTIDSREDVMLCMRSGVAAVITNRPADVLRWRRECWAELAGGSPPEASG